MTREKALDKTIRTALETVKKFKKGKVDAIYINAIHKMGCNVIGACASRGRSKKKLKK